ncbi:MAG: hypothetical protein ACOYJD_07415 [Christensenellales bacterium]
MPSDSENVQAMAAERRPNITAEMWWRDDPSSFHVGQKVNIGEFDSATIVDIDKNTKVTFERAQQTGTV